MSLWSKNVNSQNIKPMPNKKSQSRNRFFKSESVWQGIWVLNLRLRQQLSSLSNTRSSWPPPPTNTHIHTHTYRPKTFTNLQMLSNAGMNQQPKKNGKVVVFTPPYFAIYPATVSFVCNVFVDTSRWYPYWIWILCYTNRIQFRIKWQLRINRVRINRTQPVFLSKVREFSNFTVRSIALPLALFFVSRHHYIISVGDFNCTIPQRSVKL